jgi:hypothetical protein
MVTVDLALATICFLGQCYPALVGPTTPRGEFSLIQRTTDMKGYGGDVLKFHEDRDSIMAIHRVWTLSPSQRRIERLQSSDPRQRKSITNGCINVMPDVYDKLVDCCSNSTLVVK